MLDWQTFLRLEILVKYELSPKEQTIFMAKFPDENRVKTNNEVADLAIENDSLPMDAETVRKQMWNIYHKRFCPLENRVGFPNYNIRGNTAKDEEFLAWLKGQYDHWFKKQIIAGPDVVVDEEPFLINPFTPLTGKLDNPQLFFNRGKEKRRIFETLNSGSSVALIGERKIGKSSLLLAIKQLAESNLKIYRQAVYLDLQSVQKEDDFYEKLCDKLKIKTTRGYSLERELQKQNHRILLLLDEVENIKGDEFNNARAQIRGLAEGGNAPLRLVVAAKSSLDSLFPDSEGMTSPLAGIFIEEKIGRWNKETMRGFIASRLNSPLLKPGAKSVSFSEEKIAQVIEESGGHPQKLMQFCNRIYADYLEE